MQFTGTLEQQAFKALLFSVLEQNESPNAYSIAPPAGGVSGWAFGVLQYDVLNNPAAYGPGIGVRFIVALATGIGTK